MSSEFRSLLKRKQTLGAIVAAGILVAIFVPFQKAEAYTVTLNLPNASPSAVPTSAVGSTFRATVDVAAGELISVLSIELILDNTTPDVKRAVFAPNGQRTDGSPTLVRGNLAVSIPPPPTAGYGYGYGYVSTVPTFISPYSYSFSANNDFIAGNTVGYSNAVAGANFLTGLLGPGMIIIEGKLNTAQMAVGSHTLDVLINTGAGGNGVDQVVAPQLSFTTVGNSALGFTTVGSGSNVQATQNIPGSGQLGLLFSSLLSGGTIAIEEITPGTLQSLITNIFSSISGNVGIFAIGSSTLNTVGTVLEIDASSVTLGPGGTIQLTVPYNQGLLPAGLNESDLRIFHFDVTSSSWVDVTSFVNTQQNTITTIPLSSLSPIAVGFDTSDITTPPAPTPGAAGGGGGKLVKVDLTKYPESYFVLNPLARFTVSSIALANVQGFVMAQPSAGEQVVISTSFRNNQQVTQDYAYIVQITDQNGFTVELNSQIGSVESGSTAQLSRTWTAEESGTYTIKVLVWNKVTGIPMALTSDTVRVITVQ